MKLTQKLLVGAVASLFATVGMAKGTLVYCSEGSPAGFDSAQYTACLLYTSDAADEL